MLTSIGNSPIFLIRGGFILNKRQIFDTVKKYAKEYDINLNNKEFLILAKNQSNIIPFKIIFEDDNYLHLTGLRYKSSAKEFFDDCIDNKLSLNSFTCKYKDELMDLKIGALPYLTQFYKFARTIGDYNNSGYKLKTDKIVGNQSLSLGLVYPKDGKNKLQNYLQPNSLMQEDSRKLTQRPFMPIVTILSKNHNDKSFDTITYKSKNINIEKLHFPKEILAMLTPEAIKSLSPALYERTFEAEQEQTHQHTEAKTEIQNHTPQIIEDIQFDETIGDKSALKQPEQRVEPKKKSRSLDDILAVAEAKAQARNAQAQQRESHTQEKKSQSLDD
jgi:hypothetical protein